MSLLLLAHLMSGSITKKPLPGRTILLTDGEMEHLSSQWNGHRQS